MSEVYCSFISGHNFFLCLLQWRQYQQEPCRRKQDAEIHFCQQGDDGRSLHVLEHWDQIIGPHVKYDVGHPDGNGGGCKCIGQHRDHHRESQAAKGVHWHTEDPDYLTWGTHLSAFFSDYGPLKGVSSITSTAANATNTTKSW